MSVPPVFQNILSTTCDEGGNTVIIIDILSRHSIKVDRSEGATRLAFQSSKKNGI
jgi:hypothetical protein